MPRYNFCVLYAIVIVKKGQNLKMIPQNNQNTVKYINNDQFYSSRQVWRVRRCTSSSSLILVRRSLTIDSVSASLRRRAISSSWRWPITVCASSSSSEEAEVILLVWKSPNKIIVFRDNRFIVYELIYRYITT